MADTFTHFSCLLDVGTAAMAAQAHILDLATGETLARTSTDGWLAIVLAGDDPDA